MSKLNKSKQVTNSEFDYEILTAEQRKLVRQRTGEIRERLQRSAQDIWEIGQRLADVRDKIKYGQFESWLKAEFGWSRRTAYNFIKVYETFGERANLAQVNVAASALYLLAAESTPKEVKEEYLLKAKKGEKITHKELRSQIQQTKQKSVAVEDIPEDDTAIAPASLSQDTAISQAIKIIPQTVVNVEPVEVQKLKFNPNKPTIDKIFEAGWYVLEGKHLVFCGYTASSEFRSHIHDVSLAIAATSKNWDHDWLVDVAATLIVLEESALMQDKLEQLINMFSQLGETIVFPWLPHPYMIAIANKLNRKVIAGDISQERCRQAILESGLDFASINL